MAKQISIDQLKTGMVIIKVTAQNGPVKIKKSGLVSSDDMVKALAEMGVQEVEIDPDITVEVSAPKIPKSKTQQLIEGQGGFDQNLDHSISEQFNRSLFLPTVQELPEAWQYYGKKVLVALLVSIAGMAVGWSAANYSNWLAIFNNQQQQVTSPIANIPTVAENVVTANDPAALETSTSESDLPAETSPTRSVESQQSESAVPPVAEPIPQPQPDPEPEPEPASEPEQQNIINRPVEADTSQPISQDLLKRFQAAVESLDAVPKADLAPDPEPLNAVPSVNELPAWVLTKLPSMAFSAHMYATEVEDRWVRVNGKRLGVGQEIERGLAIVDIEPQHIILSFEGQEFSMEALSDW